MAKISAMMDIGKRSMMNSQTALQTTGHNIANKTTEGYSRQRVEIQTTEPVSEGNLRLGMGSKTASVTRTNNPYLERQIGNEQATLGYHTGMADAMGRVEQVYNEQINKSLNNSMSEFFNSARELSNNPESLANKTMLKESADLLAKNFNRVNSQLTEISNDIDAQIKTQIAEINSYAADIARLNERVMSVESQGMPANDERDQRDALLKKLGERINIRWAEGDSGMLTITAGNSAVMVAGSDAKTLEARATAAKGNKLDGGLEIFYRNSEHYEPANLTHQFNGGSVGGLLEVRDNIIGGLMGDVDKLAFTLGTAVNAVNRRGVDHMGQPGGEMFKMTEGVRNSAIGIQVTPEILRDPKRLPAGLALNAPGDNRVAAAIADLEGVSLMDDGTTTLNEYYNSVVGKVGIQTRKANQSVETQKDIVKQLTNIRESISGVSLDEETTKLIEFQKAFDASARLIRTADEMMETVLNIKR